MLKKFEKLSGPGNEHLQKNLKSGLLYVRRKIKGHPRIFQSTGTDKITEARKFRDELFKKYLTGKVTKKKRKLFEELAKEYLNLELTKCRRATYKNKEMVLRVHLVPHFKDMHPDEITIGRWDEYVGLTKAGGQVTNFFNHRKYLVCVLGYAHQEGYMVEDVPNYKLPDTNTKKVGKVYRWRELLRLMKAGPKDQENWQDLRLQIRMGYLQGMRKNEIRTLEWEQIDWVNETIYLPTSKTKTKKDRTFKMHKKIARLLHEKFLKRSSNWVFPSSRTKTGHTNLELWHDCKKAAGVKGRFHDLRHTFLTIMFKKDINPALICNYAGLTMKMAEKTYLHFDADDTAQVVRR